MAKNTSVKARICITIIPLINDMLEKVCEKSGISKSLLIEKAIKDFLKHQLEKDSKALSKMTFDDLPSEDDWFSLQSQIK